MRSLMSVVFLVIFCSVQTTSSAVIALESAHLKCCGEFSDVKIPVRLVTSYYRTSSNCPRRAIVFQTKAGREFCVDPETTWVSSHIDKMDKRTATATEANSTTTTARKMTATESNATKTSTESTAASTTATTAKTQSLTV